MALMQWPDYLIFVVFILVSLGIGVFHSVSGGRQRTTQEFIMADRKLNVVPTMLSLVASYQSAIMILGATAEVYNWGTQAWIMSSVVNVLALVIVERFIVPWLYPLSLTSVYEYLDLRFKSRAVAVLGSVIGVVKANLYMGIAIYAPSLALESVCGLPTHISIPLMALLCTIYTALGGMRAVIWTDVMQILVMAGGMMAVLIKASIDVGGIAHAFHQANEEGRLTGVNFSGDFTTRHTFWGFLFGGTTQWVLIYGIQQASVQRFSATKSLCQARATMLLNIPVTAVMASMAFLTGMTVLGFFSDIQCDPRANGDITSGNQVLTYFVGVSFRKISGFNGLFLATLYSGALSSVSSSLSGSAANTWKTILIYVLPKMSEKKATFINRLLVLLYGILATAIAFFASTMPGPVTQIAGTFSGAVGGPLLGLFLLGGIVYFVEWKGALIGTLCGLGLNFVVGIGSRYVTPVNKPLPPISVEGCNSLLNNSSSESAFENLTSTMVYSLANTGATIATMDSGASDMSGFEKLLSISYMWYAPLGLLVTMVMGIAASLVIRLIEGVPEPVPKSLMLQWRAGFSCQNRSPKNERTSHSVDVNCDDNKVKLELLSCEKPDAEEVLFIRGGHGMKAQ